MMFFVFILFFFGISMAMMALGYMLTDKPLERGCGKLVLGLGPCDCRKNSSASDSCRYRRKPRSKNS